MMRVRAVFAAVAVIAIVSCGGSTPPTQPPPSGGNRPTNSDPPANTKPTIDSISAQGRRAKQPPRFADVRESIDVSATVRDPETPVDELTYQWTATLGTFNGTGRTVTWTAPDTIDNSTVVTLTLKVIENFGHPGQAKIFSHDTTSTVTVVLHDSTKEVGDMSVRFLTEFSKPQTNKDWRDVMRDFKREVCPVPSEYDDERRSVEDHIANYVMNSYSIGSAGVVVSFGGMCPFNLPGDACSSARVMWSSTGPKGGTTRGTNHLSAVYSSTDQRWWLCSSRYAEDTTFGPTFYSGR
jgi:hypothetical protein